MDSLFEEAANKIRKEIEAREDDHLEILVGLMAAGFSEQDARIAASLHMDITAASAPIRPVYEAWITVQRQP